QQFDAGLLYVGHAKSWDEIIYRGEVSSRDFLAFYVKNDHILAVAGMNRDREMAAIEEQMRLNTLEPLLAAHIHG
ncbi:MAG TPA: oxidoreductase C-terminal domain-containing protein, partial [Pyrinomonadaceae bacterium]